MRRDPLAEGLAKKLKDAGVNLEQREPNPVRELAGSLAGGALGHVLARVARLGPLGASLSLAGGAVLGHLAASHRVVLAPEEAGGPSDPESPARYSDRR